MASALAPRETTDWRLPEPYYQDELATLYHADCRELLPLLDAVDHVITDPPYSEYTHNRVRSSRMVAARDRGAKGGADTRRNVDLGFAHLDDDLRRFCAQQFARVARRWVLVFSDVESTHLWRSDLEQASLRYIRTGGWIKLGATPQFSGDRPAAGFETITIAHRPGRTRWNGGGGHALWSHAIVQDRGHTGGRLHTTQKPLRLMNELVTLFTDPGELILDAFAGSGTTLVAARLAGRRVIGIEDDERCCETIAGRLQDPLLPWGDL